MDSEPRQVWSCCDTSGVADQALLWLVAIDEVLIRNKLLILIVNDTTRSVSLVCAFLPANESTWNIFLPIPLYPRF